MKQYIESYTPANAELPEKRFVKFGETDNIVTLATSPTDNIIGVTVRKPANGSVDVGRLGQASVEFGGTVARGQKVTCDSQGRAVLAQTGDNIAAVAEHSSVLNDKDLVLVK